MAIFQLKQELASYPFDYHSPVTLILIILMGQAI